MPTYEYKCSKCEHVFEVFHKTMTATAQKCPECGSKTQRQLTASKGIHMKKSRSEGPPCGRQSACKACPAMGG